MKIIRNIFWCGIFLLIFVSCNKDNDALHCQIRLVNKNDIEINSFNFGDSVYFKFYLINSSERDIYCWGPIRDILFYLRVYREIANNIYEYVGYPTLIVPNIYYSVRVKANSTTLIGSVQIDTLYWPKMYTGKYYVGDTLKLTIDSNDFKFISRTYFSVN
jgi:hypothetical protein